MPLRSAPAGEIWVALDGQTGQLDTANTYKRAQIETIEACEKRDAAAVRHLTRSWWEFWK